MQRNIDATRRRAPHENVATIFLMQGIASPVKSAAKETRMDTMIAGLPLWALLAACAVMLVAGFVKGAIGFPN